MDSILIVDDDRSIRELLSMHLEERGFGVIAAGTGAEGFRLATEGAPSAIVLDMRLPDASGIDLIPELKKRASEAPVLMITAHHDMATTILAMKAGAFDYIHKPIDIQAFDVALDRALEVRRLSKGSDYLSVESNRSFKMDDIVGTSPSMQQLFKDVGRVAASRATVLIQGESGTGKELIARVIHSYSAASKPFIGINCSAIVDTLLESELFGHEKGAFTGALQAKPGKFELAEDGSIFLDEIGELSGNLQAKLLRALQEREVERVGGVRRIAIRARILAATNRDLETEVTAGRFREDLYQRLKVVTLSLPPLRERPEDLPLLVEHLLMKINQRLHKNLRRVPREVLEKLQRRAWPGNVRELENVLTRAAVLSQGDMLLEEHLVEQPSAAARAQAATAAVKAPENDRIQTLNEIERQHIERVWALTNGHRGKTCQLLGISRPTLERKLRKYGLSAEGS
ncbi:MAG TPA: sigma-54 dependent transcriptional regulator [Myxococcales bacterium]|jgi:two-component system response regulator AtoC